MERPKIFLGVPTYDGSRDNGMGLVRAYQHANWITEIMSSSLAFCFNKIWCEMLNMRAEGRVTHFAMMHADVVPLQSNFLKILHDELVAYDADVMSVIIPIKNELGLTSTGIDTQDIHYPQRVTLHQAFALDETWTHDRLLVNTGLWIADVRPERGDWPEKICFKFQEKIVKVDGKFEPRSIPEDWDFSRQMRALGRTMYATRKVEVNHVGRHLYTNTKPWGTALEDPQHGPLFPEDTPE